jgi:hypothetical protein
MAQSFCVGKTQCAADMLGTAVDITPDWRHPPWRDCAHHEPKFMSRFVRHERGRSAC